MKYKQWNEAFVKYFFKENTDDEIILYVNKDIINKIGKINNLGGIDDFLKVLIVNVEERRSIYHNNVRTITNGNVQFNRRIQSGSIFEFAFFLSEEINNKTDLPFLNYVILAIYAKSELNGTDRSYYNNLNSLINNINCTQTDISSNNINLDYLFNNIKAFDSRFKNEKIGNLAFMGLLKYQVVLSPKEKYKFEETLFKHKITIFEDSNYHLFANKFLSVVPYQYNTLREKIKLGGSEPVYARWFLNKVKSFNPEKFSETNPNVSIGKQVGEIAIVFNPKGEKYLYLSINTTSLDNLKIEGYKFFLDEKKEDGFTTSPILLNNKKEVAFKKYQNIETNDYKFSFLQLKEVNFFQLNSLNHYQQVLNPIANTETYVAVKNNLSNIKKWEKWKDKNTENSSKSIDINFTKDLFTDEYVLYSADSINREFYTRNTNVAAIDYSKDLYIKKIGGYKLEGMNTYFDVALPNFHIQNPIGTDEEIKVSVKRNGCNDNDIIPKLTKNVINLFLKEEVVIPEEQQISVIIKLKKFEKKFDFIVIPSVLKPPLVESLYKLNKWGAKTNSNEVWYNGNKIKGSDKISIGERSIKLSGLENKSKRYNNYFIYLLSALSNKKNSSELTYSDITGLINLTKVYYDTNKINYSINDVSNYNIIRNLISLGYINIEKDGDNVTYQIAPPTLLKIEKSFFDGGNQIYKLSGARSRRLDQIIETFCRDKSITIKYRDFDDAQNPLIEHLILPSMVFIDDTIYLDDLYCYIVKELGINLQIQNKHHVGDSLLNFIESVTSFDKNFLKVAGGSYDNQEFDEGNETILPRIIKSKTDFRKRGRAFKKQYLRTVNGVFSEDKILINWAKLYVSYKQKSVVSFFKQPIWNGSELIFHPEVLIPKKVVLPSIFYKALVNLNLGLPTMLKAFVINADENLKMQRKRFILLDSYHIGTKQERRKNISRVLTGSDEVLNNDRVAFYSKYKSAISMHFVDCTTFSSVSELILFKDSNNNIIALCTKYKSVYILSENGNEIKIDNEILKVEKLKNGDKTINKIFSQIISEDNNDFKTTSIKENELVVETLKEEKIRILNLKINAN